MILFNFVWSGGSMYKKSITVKKTVVPVVVIVAGSQLIQWASSKIGMPVSDDLSAWIIAGLWGLKEGVTNWMKNRFN